MPWGLRCRKAGLANTTSSPKGLRLDGGYRSGKSSCTVITVAGAAGDCDDGGGVDTSGTVFVAGGGPEPPRMSRRASSYEGGSSSVAAISSGNAAAVVEPRHMGESQPVATASYGGGRDAALC